MTMEQPSEVVRDFHELCKKLMEPHRNVMLQSELSQTFREPTTFEQSFWVNFIAIALCEWDQDSKYKIKLSEIFRVYLTIYCDEIDKNMRAEDEPSFLRLLKGKYDKAKDIWFEIDDTRVGLFLARLALGETADGDIIKMVCFAGDIPGVSAAISPLPYKLIEDV